MFEWLRMPMGLTNAPAECQRFIDGILASHQAYCVVYIDDILIFTNGDRAEHVARVREVRRTLERARVEINDKKSQVAQREVTYLGVRIGHGTIDPILDQQALQAWPEPTNKKELQKFLGLVNWYRPFLPGLAEPASALYPLTGNVKWRWEQDHRTAFRMIKRVAKTEHRTLHRFEPTRATTVYTDASQHATGALMFQGEALIGILSKGLSPAERNYTTTEREMLGVVRAVRAWRHYIESARERVTVKTDHIALTQAVNGHHTNRRMNRWMETLMGSNVQINYVAGLRNPADLPSRPPIGGREGGGISADPQLEGNLVATCPGNARPAEQS